VWDARKPREPLWRLRHLETSWKASEVRACALRENHELVTGCYDGSVRSWSLRSSGRSRRGVDSATTVANHLGRAVEALALAEDTCISVDWAGVLGLSSVSSVSEEESDFVFFDRHFRASSSLAAPHLPFRKDSAFTDSSAATLRPSRSRDFQDRRDPEEPLVPALALSQAEGCAPLLALARFSTVGSDFDVVTTKKPTSSSVVSWLPFFSSSDDDDDEHR